MTELTIQAAEDMLRAKLAPWIQNMDNAIDTIGPNGEVTLFAGDPDKPVAHVTSTYTK
jgi:hypothetical protein